jgi:uncharacterized protein
MKLADDLTVNEAVLRAVCREHGILSMRLFGSAARNELRDDSDVDLLVECAPGRTPGTAWRRQARVRTAGAARP